MKKLVRNTIAAGVLAAGVVLLTGGAAQAGDVISHGNHGVLTGNQIIVPIQIPINLCGNGVGVLGLGVGDGHHCAAIAVMHH